MNNADKHPDYRKMYSIIKKLFEKTEHFKHGPYDETFFTTRVYETAKELIKHFLGCHKEEVLVASVLHDVGKSRLDSSKLIKDFKKLESGEHEWKKHARLGVPIAKKILKQLGHSSEFIKNVCFLVANHDNRNMKNPSIDLQIVQDADLIGDWGFSGFIRPFLYCGKFPHQSVFSAIEYSKNPADATKLFGLINLDVSRKIARKRLKLQDKLLKKLCGEVESDLLE